MEQELVVFFYKDMRMHPAITALVSELTACQDFLRAVPFPQDAVFSVTHSNWSFPSITGADIVVVIEDVKQQLNDVAEDLGTHAKYFESFLARLQFMRVNTLPQIWGNAQAAISALFMTLDVLKRAIPHVSRVDEISARRASAKQLRSIELQMKNMGVRSQNIQGMMTRIESAHEAAEQLPEDLESLNDAREQVKALLADAEKDRVHVLAAREAAEMAQKELTKIAVEAQSVLQKAEHAYSANTSQGLAAAFAERSSKLGWSMWAWVAGLVLSLGLGSILGRSQFQALADLLKVPGASEAAILLNLMLSVISVGAPIWFAWLSTKQIGQRFRLSEDYAFKASVSKAYEGYRREASRVNPDFESQLLQSALSRLDEQPLRLVEPASYGSPWHEVLASDVMKDAMKSVPNFASQLTGFAGDALAKLKPKKEFTAANSATPVIPPGEEKA
ncbi:hypothetical protein [Pseudomonas sp. PvP028]|uniref:hypothetical protein n=1 Tax=unclassified Pseudomonas TaxID=196821 RepID=UPI001B7BC8C6|nr:hypothetical protein [Pseudomonas sp. PvP028]MBP1119860.1 rubrerythrin [Pseudomonas sp. PvP028]